MKINLTDSIIILDTKLIISKSSIKDIKLESFLKEYHKDSFQTKLYDTLKNDHSISEIYYSFIRPLAYSLDAYSNMPDSSIEEREHVRQSAPKQAEFYANTLFDDDEEKGHVLFLTGNPNDILYKNSLKVDSIINKTKENNSSANITNNYYLSNLLLDHKKSNT